MSIEASALVELVYEATIEKDPWMSFLHELRMRLNSSSALMMFRPPSEGSQSVDIDDSEWHFHATRNLYYGKYCTLNPFDYERMEMGKVYSFHDFIDEESFKETEYYREFFYLLQIEHALAVYIGNANGLRAWLNICRGGDDYSREEIELVQCLLPHLQRALRIYSTLEQYRSENSIYSHTIDHMNVATVLVDNAGAISSMNDLARKMLESNGNLAIEDNSLRFSNTVANKQYDYFIKKLIDYDNDADYEAMTVGSGDNQVSLLLRRIGRLTRREFVNAPSVIVYMKEAVSKPAPMAQIVSSLFGLTRTEARMAVMLSRGQDLEQIAQGLGVTEHTARTYCKRVFAKTGTRRQAELVRLILTSLANLAT